MGVRRSAQPEASLRASRSPFLLHSISLSSLLRVSPLPGGCARGAEHIIYYITAHTWSHSRALYLVIQLIQQALLYHLLYHDTALISRA